MPEEIKPVTKKNWKTTAAGVISGVLMIGNELLAVLDDDPTTKFTTAAFLTGLGLLGIGWFARDKDVSSVASGVE